MAKAFNTKGQASKALHAVQPPPSGSLSAWGKVQYSLKGRAGRKAVEELPHLQGQTPALCPNWPDSKEQQGARRALAIKKETT